MGECLVGLGERIGGMKLQKNDSLRTPAWVYEALGPFDLDPCAGESTRIGVENYRLEDGNDGLKLPWFGFVWCNPPFSQKEIWAEKMIQHGNGILILPERGSAPWCGPLKEHTGFHFVMGKKINFEGGSSSNNLGSILFPFGPEAIERIKNSNLPGDFNQTLWFRPR